MPYYEKSEDWLKQSSLLIEARPSTTRVTTTYSIKPSTSKPSPTTSTPTPSKPHGHLVLKTYDPVSGTCLKYKTSKAAEVSRLIQMLGALGRKMAGVPDGQGVAGAGAGEDEVMVDAPAVGLAEGGSGTNTPGGEKAVPGAVAGQAQAGGGGGGKGKKKKGKR